MIEYYEAPDIKRRVDEIIELLHFDHICRDSIYCVRSRGSKSRRTIARIHGLGRIWQQAMDIEPSYLIEVIAEKFDALHETDQDKTLIHELLHVPVSFKGGFRPHKGYVNRETVEIWYYRLKQKRHI